MFTVNPMLAAWLPGNALPCARGREESCLEHIPGLTPPARPITLAPQFEVDA